MKSERGLTPKQEAFVREYLVDLNGTQAYLRAGYKSSEEAARRSASDLLTNPDIVKAVQEEMKARQNRTEITADFVLGGLKEVAQRCMQKVPVMRFDREKKCMVQETAFVQDPETGEIREEGIWEFDSSGANRSLELLGKHLGVFRDLTGEQDAPPVARVEIRVTDARKK